MPGRGALVEGRGDVHLAGLNNTPCCRESQFHQLLCKHETITFRRSCPNPALPVPAPPLALISAKLLGAGQRLVEPITSGTIVGPAFNATIEGVLEALILVGDMTGSGKKALLAYIWADGIASDGSPFFMEKPGVGRPAGQNTRLHIQVGGEYQSLQTLYVLAQPSVMEEMTLARVESFGVLLPSQ
ncbi:hypothetical protein C8A05DRAFT_20228 [Staphylotrichum tortipilum]|uniref:Uncharacterized protein n=1 Tax=Staphylotrichum tortipilum TaxID=2831512 RepID=A0AAN6RP09_9PEZI|nr:hypothetical protein C8A05DRAFT_20228 [Staphylotrichum longicolle]